MRRIQRMEDERVRKWKGTNKNTAMKNKRKFKTDHVIGVINFSLHVIWEERDIHEHNYKSNTFYLTRLHILHA